MANPVPIQVALDTTADPQVTVIPFAPTVSRHEEIIWTPIGNVSFAFVSLKAEKKTLHDPIVNPTQITATYDAKGKDHCDYTIVVRDANGGLHDTKYRGGIEGGGSPTIKNN
jgi:hypothetical protein